MPSKKFYSIPKEQKIEIMGDDGWLGSFKFSEESQVFDKKVLEKFKEHMDKYSTLGISTDPLAGITFELSRMSEYWKSPPRKLYKADLSTRLETYLPAMNERLSRSLMAEIHVNVRLIPPSSISISWPTHIFYEFQVNQIEGDELFDSLKSLKTLMLTTMTEEFVQELLDAPVSDNELINSLIMAIYDGFDK